MTTADQGRDLRFVTTAANRHTTWGMGLSAPFAIPAPVVVTPPPVTTTPPPVTTTPPPADTTPPPAGTKPPATGSTVVRPPFSCKVKRGTRLTLSCTVRNTAGKPRTTRIRAMRGKHVVGRASGRVRHGNQVPILRLKRTARRSDTRITIVVTLANGKTRTMTRTLKL